MDSERDTNCICVDQEYNLSFTKKSMTIVQSKRKLQQVNTVFKYSKPKFMNTCQSFSGS
jgi:hypothetical protein